MRQADPIMGSGHMREDLKTRAQMALNRSMSDDVLKPAGCFRTPSLSMRGLTERGGRGDEGGERARNKAIDREGRRQGGREGEARRDGKDGRTDGQR